MPAVSNTSPVFNLAAIDQLHLLREQFGKVIVPDAVLDELESIRDRREWQIVRRALDEGWIASHSIQEQRALRALTLDLDQGESEAILLALELGISTVLMDESDGRAIAVKMGLKPTGVLGILLKAKVQGRISSIVKEMAALRNRLVSISMRSSSGVWLSWPGKTPSTESCEQQPPCFRLVARRRSGVAALGTSWNLGGRHRTDGWLALATLCECFT